MKKSVFLSILMFAAAVVIPAQTVAVFDFDCDDVTVVERKKIDKVMAEYRFQANPYIDITTAKQMGNGIGADKNGSWKILR